MEKDSKILQCQNHLTTSSFSPHGLVSIHFSYLPSHSSFDLYLISQLQLGASVSPLDNSKC